MADITRGIASSATAVVIGHVAGGTKSIRVVQAASCCLTTRRSWSRNSSDTCRSIPWPHNLGLGRAPGTDGLTAQALRRTLRSDLEISPGCVWNYATISEPMKPARVARYPAMANVPIYILGSSLFGAQLAALLGMPFAFASHFAPTAMMQAIEIYRDNFEPSEQLTVLT